ncbi:hypothetical protein, partial [Psychromonas hadalis]|uniref:hypothetical protein n=1 Tax=Psychromonas hadalis TaxID=211669 RepID=UPI00146D238D
VENDKTSYFTMLFYLDSLDDNEFEQQAGDVWEWDERRDNLGDGEENFVNLNVIPIRLSTGLND